MDTSSFFNKLWHPVSIGAVTIPGNIFLAPLAGYTDRAFRAVCRQQGAALTYSEMVSAEGVASKGANSESLMLRGQGEDLFAIQLFMNDAEVVERALERVLTFNPTVLDINCGCPVPKVVKTGAGSSLMLQPHKIHDIVKTITKACSVPVSVKIRTGWDARSINWAETSDAAIEGGASMITMHARTKSMGYSGKADWQALADLKNHVDKRSREIGRPIVAFGSGDVFSAGDAQAMLAETALDGLMFARGAIGNPFVFADTIALLTGQSVPSLHPIAERVAVMRLHLSFHVDSVGEHLACRQMRKHAAAYLRGMKDASRAKQELVRATTVEQYARVFDRLLADGDTLWEEVMPLADIVES